MILNESKKILFYDGDCGFCNSSVQFALSHQKNEIYFATLQSKFALDLLNKNGIKIELDTLYFYKNGKIYDKSSGALRLAKELKFPYNLLFAFYIVPKFLRNTVYSFIAKRRHRIKNGFCVNPSKTEKKLFLTDNSQL